MERTANSDKRIRTERIVDERSSEVCSSRSIQALPLGRSHCVRLDFWWLFHGGGLSRDIRDIFTEAV